MGFYISRPEPSQNTDCRARTLRALAVSGVTALPLPAGGTPVPFREFAADCARDITRSEVLVTFKKGALSASQICNGGHALRLTELSVNGV